MKIHKIINNNVISTFNEQNKELVIMGRGIAFQAKVGEPVRKDRIEKIFTMEDKEVNEKFKTLLEEIPMEVMEVAEKIIGYAKTTYSKKLNDIIYVSLPDHIHFAIERHQKGMMITNGLLWEIKKIYRDEFLIGKEAIKMIKDKFNIELPEDEAGFIATHIVNAELNDEMTNVNQITKVIQQILNIVKYHFGVDFDEESLNYFRFITHLKFFAQRLMSNTSLNGVDEDFFLLVKQKHKESFICTEKINLFLQKEYQYELSTEEMLYLTIHIQRVVNR